MAVLGVKYIYPVAEENVAFLYDVHNSVFLFVLILLITLPA